MRILLSVAAVLFGTRGKRRAGARDDDHDRQADRNLHSLRPGDSRRRPPFRRRPLGRALRRVTGECRGGGQTAKHAIRHRSIGRARFHHHLLGRSGSTHDGSIDADDLPALRRGGASGRPPGHRLAGRPRWQACGHGRPQQRHAVDRQPHTRRRRDRARGRAGARRRRRATRPAHRGDRCVLLRGRSARPPVRPGRNRRRRCASGPDHRAERARAVRAHGDPRRHLPLATDGSADRLPSARS